MAKVTFTGLLPIGVTVSEPSGALFESLSLLLAQGKDVIVALSGLFK